MSEEIKLDVAGNEQGDDLAPLDSSKTDQSRTSLEPRKSSIDGSKLRHIVIPIDGSPTSMKAIDFYKTHMFQGRHDIVYIVHIPEPLSLPFMRLQEGASVPFHNWHSKLQDRLQKTRKLEDELNYRLDQMGVNRASGVIVSHVEGSQNKADLSKYICEEAEKKTADFIIMASRGWGKVATKLFGSISDHVVHNAFCPVVIVPPSKEERGPRRFSLTK